MNEYHTIHKVLTAEQRRRRAFYRFRPSERAAAMKEVADALAALERLRRAAEWKSVGKTAAAFWQDKFDG